MTLREIIFLGRGGGGGRSPRCDQVVTFDWAEEQKYIAWMDDVPDVRPGPTPPPAPEPELLADIVTTFDWGAEQQYIAWMDGTPLPRPTLS